MDAPLITLIADIFSLLLNDTALLNVVIAPPKLLNWSCADNEKLFRLLNIVVDVAFKLFIDSVEPVDKLFR